MSGADRAATTGVGTCGFADTRCESDFPVLVTVPSARAPRGGQSDAVITVRQILSGSSGSVVNAGVC